jgi:hypothetical protein
LQELAECCALLDHALERKDAGKAAKQVDLFGPAGDERSRTDLIERTVEAGRAGELALLLRNLLDQLADLRGRLAALEKRLGESEVRESV